MENEFRRSSNAAGTPHNINDVYGVNTADERPVWCWFERFCQGDFGIKNQPCG